MKTILFVLTIVILLHSLAVYGKQSGWAASHPTAKLACLQRTDSQVRTYFVRGAFTAGEMQMLWRTLETWTQTAGAASTLRFSNAGETGGLINCVGCLTLTRQNDDSNQRKRDVSFNRLGSDQTGRLISAWIEFDSDITDSRKLRRLLVRVLDAESLPRDEVAARQTSLNASTSNCDRFARDNSQE
jgi:hypothetical protein